MSEVTSNFGSNPEDNPFYLLATIDGVPAADDQDRINANRIAWNRYYASSTGPTAPGISDAEKVPLTDEELSALRRKFAARADGRSIALPSVSENINFSGCIFEKPVSFQGYVFRRKCDFNNTTFKDEANFSSVAFVGDVNFDDSKLMKMAKFNNSIFHERSSFCRTVFSNTIYFESAKFHKSTSFENAVFEKSVYFESATFGSSITFVNTEMKARTTFERCNFKRYPPDFAGAKLHEGTIWEAKFPAPPTQGDASRFIIAYERLKLEMDRLKKHEDELKFFAMELECRRVIAPDRSKWPFLLYRVLCNYGQSFVRPFIWLMGVIIVGALPLWWVKEPRDLFLSLGISTANTLGSLGLRKDLIDPETLQGLPDWAYLLSGLQTVLGLVLLFLISLGLRNRFRMR
ncbi:pentapeptide repeat-containing protein [Niveispirillum fermenti]|uniref:pentapeptide repeat-containing protein n=1 Tax=Niveispirillum fermenti TaxID=1233113 RepID=UPI003A89F609